MAVKKKKEEEKAIDLFKSNLVPVSKILSEEDAKELLEKYNVSKQQLPRILAIDPVCKALNVKSGDIIEFTRKSKTAGLSKYYRVVVGGLSE